MAAAVGLHVTLNRRAFLGWLRCAFSRGRRAGAAMELVLYAAFSTVAVTGIVAWLFVAGSAPLGGPVSLERLPRLRHHLVDVHHFTGLVALAFTIHHATHRWRRMVRGLRSAFRPGLAAEERELRDGPEP